MKKLLSLAMALMLMVSMATMASASTTTLTTTVPGATYTLNIPADQEIPYNATSTKIGNVTVTDTSGFAVGKNLEVKVEHTAFTSEQTDTDIEFGIYLEDGNQMIKPMSGALLFKGQNDGSVTERAVLNSVLVKTLLVIINDAAWGAAQPGNYTATITFTAEIVSQ